MDFISIKEVAHKFKKSEADLIKKCEHGEIKNCCLIKGQWFIPKTINNNNENHINSIDNSKPMTLKEISKELSISIATVQNWIKLGKLKPNLVTNNKLGFSHQYINKIKSNLQSGKNNALKSRRNKKFASGNFLYKDYVSENCINIQTIQQLFNLASTKHVEFDDNAIQYLVAECAISIFVEKLQIPITHNANYLEQFLSNKIDLKKYNQLILDLIIDKIHASEYCKHNTELFSFTYSFECREDILGLMYLSCKNICNRKASGSYYTPTNIVQKLISKLPLKENSSILDPCCGTGNFLLQLTKYQNFKNIYGNDIDPISVKITRLNMALHYPEQDIDTIYAHITQKDYLLDSSTKEFDFIVGNPPWGCEFTENTKKELKQLYKCASLKNIESYDIFIESALDKLNLEGQLAFVLPEAILNVKAHTEIRKLILAKNSIHRIEFLGEAFHGVQCPCIILQLKYNNKPLSTMGLEITQDNLSFTIKLERKITADHFSFTTTDSEYLILQKLHSQNNITYLENNADFAMGVVTGDNSKYISANKNTTNETILRGTDVFKYHFQPTTSYITFKPESFQQSAPTTIYRAKEKLLYRFICNQLVFAYDDKQTLSLNSCNIVIPKIAFLKTKYILAILNSRIAQFIYKKEFNSLKVLRSHIEALPIPVISENLQDEIIELITPLIQGTDIEISKNIYNIVDGKIANLFNLTGDEYQIIKNSTTNSDIFLG